MSHERGQATVELALCLPIVVLLLGCVVAVGRVVSDHTRVWHAAREAARVAAVDADLAEIRFAAGRSGLDGIRVEVSPSEHERVAGEPATVTAIYSPRVTVPLIGTLLAPTELKATATMAIEVP